MAFEAITDTPRSQKIILGLLLLAVIGAGGYFLVLSPKLADVGALRVKNATLQSEVSQSRAIAQNLAGFRQEAARLRERLEAAKERLPSEKEIPTLYRQISDLAFQAGLVVSLFQPKEPLPRDIYLEVPISVSGQAGFHQVGNFFERLSRLARIVTLTDIKLQGTERPTATVKADLTLATYLFRPEGAPPPAPPKGAPGAKPGDR
jgi:type IV pilus assembly protein PilO